MKWNPFKKKVVERPVDTTKRTYAVLIEFRGSKMEGDVWTVATLTPPISTDSIVSWAKVAAEKAGSGPLEWIYLTEMVRMD